MFPLRFRGTDEAWGWRSGETAWGEMHWCPCYATDVSPDAAESHRPTETSQSHSSCPWAVLGASYFFLLDRDVASDPRFVEGCARREVGERKPARIDLGTTKVLRVMLTSSECSRCGDRGTEEQCVCTSNYVGIECWLTLLPSSGSSPTVALPQ